MSRSQVISCALLLTLAARPGWTAQEPGEEELKQLIARAAKAEKLDQLRHDVMSFQRKHPGTPAAVKAAGLLRDLPSPLDRLDPKTIPELERFDWHPKETVAVLGEHRGRQGGAVTSVLFSRHGRWLASGSTNGTLRFWDAATMRVKHTLGHSYGVYCLAVSKDSGLLAVGDGYGQVRLWDTSGDAPKEKDKDKGLLKVCSTPLLGLALAPDMRTFACGGSDTRVYLWDLTADPPKETSGGGHTGVVRAVVYSPSGHLIASAGDDKFIRLWSLTDNRLKEKLSVEGPAAVYCLAFHPTEEKTLVSGSADGTIHVWEVGTKLKERITIKARNAAVNAITFSASGKTIAAAFADGTARTWGYGTKLTEKATLEGHKAASTAVAFSPDGTLIATGSADWTVRLWPGVSGVKPRDKTVDRGHLSHVYSVAFNPDGTGLASGSYDATVRLWDLAAAEPKERISKLKDEGAIYTVAFTPDGKTLAAGGINPMFRTCDAAGSFLFGFKGHTGHISRLACSPDGKLIASCGTDKTIRLWEVQTGKGKTAITAFDAFTNSVAFSPDGKHLLCASGHYLYDKLGQIVTKGGEYIYNDSTVRVYDVANYSELARWKWDKVLTQSIAYAPDGRTFLAGGTDNLLRRWDALKLPKEPEVIYKEGPTSALAISPDGRWLAGYIGYRVQLIDLATRKKVREWVTGEQFGNLAFAPDSRHLAISVGTGVVLVLRLEGPKQSG
jgi:WD40 repeat protein